MMPNPLLAVRDAAIAAPELAKLKKATDGLEAFMFKTLLKNVGGKDGLFAPKMPGSEVYRDMFEQNLADMLASRGQIGIGQTLYRNVSPLAAQQALKNAKQVSKIEKEA